MTLNAISYYITAEYADSQCMFSHDLGTNSCTIPYENFPARGSNPSDGGVSESTDPSELAATGTILPSNLSKNRFFDGYSYNQLLDKDTGNSLSIGSDYERGTATPLTSNGNGMCTYVGSTDGTDCTPGRLSFSPTIESRFGLFGNALASLFPTFFAPGGGSGVTAIAMSNNARFDGLHQDDAVLLTNGNQNIKDVNGNDTTVTLEGGYIDPITNGYADPTSGLLKKQYIFSDWDNTNTNSFRMDYQNYNIGPTQEDRQAQRASIKNEIAKSAASLDTGTDPSKGVKFVSWTISKDDFRSLNGILRLGKNSLSEWTNLKIVDPNTGKLLSETKPEESIYSWNNLVVKYGDKYYTWGDHDTSCNGINPWKTFKGLNDTSSMDSQGMTICLSNG